MDEIRTTGWNLSGGGFPSTSAPLVSLSQRADDRDVRGGLFNGIRPQTHMDLRR
jgi:hypothetical protein